MKNQTRSLSIGAGMLLASLSSNHAAPIAYDGFDYPQLTSLNDLSISGGGTGWTVDWTTNRWRTNHVGYGEIDTGLTYTGLTTVGQAARHESDYEQTFRYFAAQPSTGIYWVSFLIQKETTAVGSFGISLYDGGSEKNFLGQAASDKFSAVVDKAGAGNVDSSIAVTETPTLFVARYNMDSGKAHFWLNPDLSSSAPTDASAFNGAAGSTFTPFSFDGIRLGRFESSPGYLDEIRIGTSAQDVGFSAGETTGLATFRAANELAPDGSQDLLTPAGDGVTNLLKFAFNMLGSDPGQATSLTTPNVAVLAPAGTAGLPRLATESGTGKLQLTYIRRKAGGLPAPGISYTVEFSDALASWAVNGGASESAISVDPTFESVTVTDSAFFPKRFVRVRVSAH